MINALLQDCNERLPLYACCNQNNYDRCDCSRALRDDYGIRADRYECHKKMDTYILTHGPRNISELYHYLEESHFENELINKERLNIISLGCGFSPDYYAIKHFLDEKGIHLPVSYRGIDSSNCWSQGRPANDECRYITQDLTSPFNLEGADVVIISKLFSTLYRNGGHEPFLEHLQHSVIQTFNNDTMLIFMDVNSQDMGRDVFHNNAVTFLSRYRQYYFDGYTGYGWSRLNNNNVVVNVPQNLAVEPHRNTGKTVIFEYKV